MINSITDESGPFRLAPAAHQGIRHERSVALCMTESGPPAGVDDRVEIASRLVDRLVTGGIALDDIYVDPCVFPISSGCRIWPGGAGGGRAHQGLVSRGAHQLRSEQRLLRTCPRGSF